MYESEQNVIIHVKHNKHCVTCGSDWQQIAGSKITWAIGSRPRGLFKNE